MHGYEIAKKTKELTQGKVLLTEGALYPALKKLLDQKFICAQTESHNGRKRKYYTITDAGLEFSNKESNEFVEFVESMLVLLQPNLSTQTQPPN